VTDWSLLGLRDNEVLLGGDADLNRTTLDDDEAPVSWTNLYRRWPGPMQGIRSRLHLPHDGVVRSHYVGLVSRFGCRSRNGSAA
jgi:hypothetical protein